MTSAAKVFALPLASLALAQRGWTRTDATGPMAIRIPICVEEIPFCV